MEPTGSVGNTDARGRRSNFVRFVADETAMVREHSPYSLESSLSWPWAVLLLITGVALLWFVGQSEIQDHGTGNRPRANEMVREG